MNKLNKYIPRVEKKTLLMIAGLVWGIAGIRVFTLGSSDVQNNNGNLITTIMFASIVFFMFFKFIFSKMSKKHTKRIITSHLDKHCIFSFFDIKSYIIMAFMMSFGIIVRNMEVFNPVYLGTFYIGLGGALLMAGVTFLINAIRFENTKIKYTNQLEEIVDEI